MTPPEFKADPALVQSLIPEVQRFLAEEPDIREDMLDGYIRSALTTMPANHSIYAFNRDFRPKNIVPTREEIKAFLAEMKEKIKPWVCTKQIEGYLDSEAYTKAIEALIAAIISALAVGAPGPALLALIVAAAAYFIRRGIYLLCEWPEPTRIPTPVPTS